MIYVNNLKDFGSLKISFQIWKHLKSKSAKVKWSEKREKDEI